VFEQLTGTEPPKLRFDANVPCKLLTAWKATLGPPLAPVGEVLRIERWVQLLASVRLGELAFDPEWTRLLVVEHYVNVGRRTRKAMRKLALELKRLIGQFDLERPRQRSEIATNPRCENVIAER
jgi:hypothetical protein